MAVSTVRATVAVDTTVQMTDAFRLQSKQAVAQRSERPPDCQNSSASLNRLIRPAATLRAFPAHPLSHNQVLAGLVQCEPHTLSDLHKNDGLKGSVSAASKQQMCSV